MSELVVCQTVALRETRNIGGGCSGLARPAPIVLAASARALSAACGALNYVLAVVLICAGAGLEAAGRALMAEVRGDHG